MYGKKSGKKSLTGWLTDTIQATGGVQCLSWTPDGCAIAVAWSWTCHGGLAVWSVFGSLLMCTLGGDYG